MDILVIDDQPTVCVCVAEKIHREISKTRGESFSVTPLFNLAAAEDLFRAPPYPQLVVLDLDLGVTNGLETLRCFREILASVPCDISIAIFSGADFLSHDGVAMLRKALNDFGVKGILPKNAQIDRMLIGLGRLLEGETWIPDDLMKGLLTFDRDDLKGKSDKRFALTPRELEIVRCIAKGMADKEIAKALDVTHGYVRQVVSRILGKLGVNNRTKIAMTYADADQVKEVRLLSNG